MVVLSLLKLAYGCTIIGTYKRLSQCNAAIKGLYSVSILIVFGDMVRIIAPTEADLGYGY